MSLSSMNLPSYCSLSHLFSRLRAGRRELNGSSFFTQIRSPQTVAAGRPASCTTSLFYVNLFKELFPSAPQSLPANLSVCVKCRSFLKADAKVWLFSLPCKIIAEKVLFSIGYLTLVHIQPAILCTHTFYYTCGRARAPQARQGLGGGRGGRYGYSILVF